MRNKSSRKKDDKEFYLPNSFVTKNVEGSNFVICSRWPAIQRYSWICEEDFFLSSGLSTDWVVVVVADIDFDFFSRVIRRNKCFKNRYRAKQQSFSK